MKFIDYGNTATTSHLCELPAELAAIAPLATHCALAPTTTSADDVVAATLDEEEFAELLAAEGETAYHFDLAESSANGATTVRMFRDAERTQEIRVRAAAVEPQPSAAVPEPLPAGSDFSGLVSWTNSPLDFFVQPTHLSGSLIELTERLESAPAIGHLVNPTVGQLCAAKFVDDGMFYRARILSEESNTNGEYDCCGGFADLLSNRDAGGRPKGSQSTRCCSLTSATKPSSPTSVCCPTNCSRWNYVRLRAPCKRRLR